MEKRSWNEKRIAEEEQKALEESIKNRLCTVAHRIVPDESARERVIEGVKQGKHGRRKQAFQVHAAVFAACLLLFLLWIGMPVLTGEEVVVYAATEENGWQKLEEGERILLKMEPFMVVEDGEDIEDFDEYGYPYYYPYKCIFRVEVPEDYLYDKQMVMIGDDHIMWKGDEIEWHVAPDRPGDEGKVRQGTFRIWVVSDYIVNQRRERVAALDLELIKEDGKCYAELKRVWETEMHQKAED